MNKTSTSSVSALPRLRLDNVTPYGMSVQNYFLSPKMPVKDHINAFRCSQTNFQVQKPKLTEVIIYFIQKGKGILEKVDINFL